MGRVKLVIMESQILLAMKNTKSNKEAARFLKVSYSTYQYWAKMYKDVDGISLYKKHANPGNRGSTNKKRISIEAVLNGDKKVPIQLFKELLIKNDYILPECTLCGFHEKRITDNRSPLIAVPIDNDPTNLALENLELYCYNCYFLTIGNVVGGNKKTKKIDQY